MSQPTKLPPQGWYPDPAGSGLERYWDGASWSQVTRPGSGATPGTAGGYTSGAARPAAWGWRVLAFLLDGAIWFLPIMLIQGQFLASVQGEFDAWAEEIVARSQQGSTTFPDLPASVVGAMLASSVALMVVWALYRTVCVALWGGTLGQLICKLRVVRDGDASHAKIGWGRSLLRAVVSVILLNIFLVSLIDGLLPLFTAKNQAGHDLLVKTVVLRRAA